MQAASFAHPGSIGREEEGLRGGDGGGGGGGGGGGRSRSSGAGVQCTVFAETVCKEMSKGWHCTCCWGLARFVVLLRLYAVPATGKNAPVGMSCWSTGVMYDLHHHSVHHNCLRAHNPTLSLPLPTSCLLPHTHMTHSPTHLTSSVCNRLPARRTQKQQQQRET